MNPKPGAAHMGRAMPGRAGQMAAARYPYATGSYESITTDLNNKASKHGLKDTAMEQLKHAKAYQKKVPHKQYEKSVALINKWTTMDKSLKHKNEYEKVLDLLKNTKLKGLTNEQLGEREKHMEKLFKAITG
jgi:hypothetical protein